MSYGSAAGVAALTPRYLVNGVYHTTTTPTLATVTAWLAEVSALFDVALNHQRFVTPVVQASALSALGAQVNGYVAELARSINGHGAYGTAGGDLRPITEIYNDILAKFTDWLLLGAAGLEALGVVRLDEDLTVTAGVVSMRRATVDEINEADGLATSEYTN